MHWVVHYKAFTLQFDLYFFILISQSKVKWFSENFTMLKNRKYDRLLIIYK